MSGPTTGVASKSPFGEEIGRLRRQRESEDSASKVEFKQELGITRMFTRQLTAAVVGAILAAAPSVRAGDIKLTLPKRSQLTPVQRLNRDGVDAVRHHQYEKAETLFYRAYLFDPGDPFTLYNLGYISELQGQLERAQTFYKLASEQATDAVIDRTSVDRLQGKPMKAALGGLQDVSMQVNQMNVEAIRLLSRHRAREADEVLQQALRLNARDAFTLNNLGVAKEAEGDYDQAVKYYTAAADSHSTDPVIVTLSREWRGKPLTEMATDSARKLRDKMQVATSTQARAAILTARGVAETNRNDWGDARQDFLKAYSLDPASAFALNNVGYVAEMDGDLETAEFFYERAQKAGDSSARVGIATRRAAEGMNLSAVASESDQSVDQEMVQENQTRRREAEPVGLKHRDNTPVVEPPSPPPANSEPSPQPQPQ